MCIGEQLRCGTALTIKHLKNRSSLKILLLSKLHLMQVDDKLVLRLEKLARLKLSEEERAQIQGDLNEILTMVDKLQEINTDDTVPLTYINEEVNVLREDKISNQATREAALKNAPKEDGTYFKVPKVIG